MKNSKIHSMYSESMIRDFLSKEYEEGYKKSGYQSVSSIEKQIEKLQKELEYAKKRESSIVLMTDKGWDVFDVSDCIEDYGPDFFPFVGTKTEYDYFIAQCEE